MKNQQTVRSFEYKNDFFYFVIRQAPEQGPRSWLYCCGISIPRFDPLCWAKAGICSNPAFKGLQQLRADVSAHAVRLGVGTKNAEHIPCGPITPAPGSDGWYRENALQIDGATPEDIRNILEFSVLDLVKTVLAVCAPDAKLPARCPSPPAMQRWLESLGIKNYKEMAPPPIARMRDQDKK